MDAAINNNADGTGTHTSTATATDSQDDEESRLFCVDFLKGKCKHGSQCRLLHLQLEHMAQAKFCPLHVVGQCTHQCKYGLTHQLGFQYEADVDYELFKILSDTHKTNPRNSS